MYTCPIANAAGSFLRADFNESEGSGRETHSLSSRIPVSPSDPPSAPPGESCAGKSALQAFSAGQCLKGHLTVSWGQPACREPAATAPLLFPYPRSSCYGPALWDDPWSVLLVVGELCLSGMAAQGLAVRFSGAEHRRARRWTEQGGQGRE